MFKKPFRIKSQSVMKGSDRKKLRAEIGKSFPHLDGTALIQIIPNKEEVVMVKIYTNTGDNAFIYCSAKIPLLFEIDKQKILYPTVYLLWRFPRLVPVFTTWPPVFNKLVDGADLMLPGLVVRGDVTPHTFKHIHKGQTCSISIHGNQAPVAVGYTMMSGSDMYESAMKGKGVHAVHLLGDELWAYGDKSSPPDLPDEPFPDSDGEDTANIPTSDMAESPGMGDTVADMGVAVEVSHTQVADGEADNDTEAGAIRVDTEFTDVDIGSLDIADKDDGDDVAEAPLTAAVLEGAEARIDDSDGISAPEDMDELLQFCFLCAIKSSLKKTDLPLLTGTFYKSHMMRFCPTDRQLDIKKSSYKKLSKFLSKQVDAGIILVQEVSKGVDQITDMRKSHESLRGFIAPEPVELETTLANSDGEYVAPRITEMFAVSVNVLPLFKTQGCNKGTALKSSDIKKVVTDYVKANNLQSAESKGEVQLDPILAEVLLTKAEGDRSTLRWDDIFSRLHGKMTPVHQIQFPRRAPIIRKGNIEPIKIDVLQRASNKKVTVIENLDLFGIDPKEFGHDVQIKVACSASVTPSPQKNKGPQVVIQGNQISCIGDFLVNKYQIPRKFIKGLEKAPKSKRR